MKCAIHNEEATGICAYCGRGICLACNTVMAAERIACSQKCADALERNDRAVGLILSKHIQGARVSAYFLYAAGLLFLAVGVYGYILYPRMRVVHPMAVGFGIVLIVAGIAYHRLAKKGPTAKV